MNSEEVKLVQESWAKVVPIAEEAAALFYSELFALDPSVRALFKSDMKAQGRKLTSMLNTAVANLTKLEDILPAVEDLGRRHVGYGVRDEHYGTVGTALLTTLEKGLGEAFTPPVREAWAKAYGALAGVMQSAAAEVGSPDVATA